jgi:antitoxin component of MazEF toxin-antitoxin module
MQKRICATPGGSCKHLDIIYKRYYSNYVKTIELKVSRIGNSRGVRLPAASLRRYRIGAALLMEERSEGIFLRPVGPAVEKLSWEDTAREMAASLENWGEWDATAADGLGSIPWESGVSRTIAESKTRYRSAAPSAKKS